MVREDGATKLADFGIASVQGDPRLTATGLVVGSPAYMAPEQVEAQAVSPATDLWALGATLWFAVEGQPPFGGGEFQTLSAIVSGQPRRPERLGPWPRSWPACWSRSRRAARPRPAPAPAAPGRRGRGRAADPALGDPAGAAPAWAGAVVVAGRAAGRTTPPEPSGVPAGGGERGSVASGDTPPVPGRVRRREDDGGPEAGRREAAAGAAAPGPAGADAGEPVLSGARRRRARVPVVFAAVAVVLFGAVVWQGLTRDTDERPPPATTRRPAVPAGWRSFQDPDGTYRLSFPPTWTPSDRGPFIDFTEPGGQRFFRVQPTTDGLPPVRPAEPGAVVRRQASRRRLPPAAPGRHHLPERAGGRVGVHLPRRGPADARLRHHLRRRRPPPRHPVPGAGQPLGRLPGRAPGLPGRLPPPRLTAAAASPSPPPPLRSPPPRARSIASRASTRTWRSASLRAASGWAST